MLDVDRPERPARGSLDDRSVLVWFAQPLAAESVAETYTLRQVLSSEEQQQALRFRFPRDRSTFVTAHSLLRLALSSCTGLPLTAWAFTHNAYGKPEIAPQIAAPPLRFSISHTTDLVACAITLRQDIGIDVEDASKAGLSVDPPTECFHRSEIEELRDLPAETRVRQFYHLWTLKEAYAKARGLGLNLAFNQYRFQIGQQPNSENDYISLKGPDSEATANWAFRIFHPTTIHIGALAVAQTQGKEIDLQTGMIALDRILPPTKQRRGVSEFR